MIRVLRDAHATDWLTLAGRILLAALFLAGVVQKVADPGAAQALLAGRGLAVWLIWPATAFTLVAGLGLLTGPWVRGWALLLAFYCMVTSVFHLIPSDPWQMSIFVKNWAVAGGLLALAGQGPGSIVWWGNR
ncbi:DoxX family protein [Roseicitreum antarcticum]|uniref:Putative oxidoreductase n=1 Tax=Roseicitreum antarcticum TaxID=564137 RepID=A0A1H2ZZK9_9RHOB|nr:DoxX family protein [Roseicitreum antarcticum]SDX22806.1 putative oxidoreductase [Roseicitreum antarcticum]